MSTSGLTATNIANAFDVNLIYARQLFQSVSKDSTGYVSQSVCKSLRLTDISLYIISSAS